MHDVKLKELAKKASSGDMDALGDFLLAAPRGSIVPGCEKEAAKSVSEKGMSVLVEVRGIPTSPGDSSSALDLMKELHEQWEPESDEGKLYKDQLSDAIAKAESGDQKDKEDKEDEEEEEEEEGNPGNDEEY